MPRTGAGLEIGCRRLIWRQGAAPGIKVVHQDFVDTQIGDQGKAVVGRGFDPMGVRTLLSFVVRTRSTILSERRSGSQTSILEYGQSCYVSPGVIGDEYIVSGFIQADVTGISPAG